MPSLDKDKDKSATNKFSKGWFLFFSLLFLGIIVFAGVQGWFKSGIIPLHPVEPTSVVPLITDTPTTTPTATSTNTLQPEPSNTPTRAPIPSATQTSGVVNSPVQSPTLTYTPTYTPVGTNTIQAPVTVNPTATIKYPDGNRFRLYYNENSIYLHNLSNVTRSISGFTFERLNDEGQVREFFGGWDWGRYFPNISPDRCMAIELYLSPPFLKPSECKEPYLSLLNPLRDAGHTFWTTRESSHEFRVLWEREEIARCVVGTGGCEFFVP